MLTRKMLILLLLSNNASAFEWKDLWYTVDQQGMKLLDNGQAEQATEKFADPGWKGVGAYQAGKFEDAATLFQEDSKSTKSQYNLGNAKVKSGDLKGAIATYDALLDRKEIDKKLQEDAQFNRDLVQKLLQQQQKQQSQDSQSPDSEQSEENDSSKENKNNKSEQEQNSNEQKDQNQSDRENNDKNSQDQSSVENQQEQSEQGNLESEQKQDEDSKEKEKEKQQQAQPSQESEPISEDQQAIEQWLRRIPDDPSGLLRRKLIQSHKNEFPEIGNSRQPW